MSFHVIGLVHYSGTGQLKFRKKFWMIFPGFANQVQSSSRFQSSSKIPLKNRIPYWTRGGLLPSWTSKLFVIVLRLLVCIKDVFSNSICRQFITVIRISILFFAWVSAIACLNILNRNQLLVNQWRSWYFLSSFKLICSCTAFCFALLSLIIFPCLIWLNFC